MKVEAYKVVEYVKEQIFNSELGSDMVKAFERMDYDQTTLLYKLVGNALNEERFKEEHSAKHWSDDPLS